MAVYREDAQAFLTGQLGPQTGPRAITKQGQGGKFDPEGRVLPYPGNTILCHIPKGGAAFSALLSMQQDMKQSPFGRYFTFLPPESFHMTVFEGVSASAEIWPHGLSRALSRDDVTRVMQHALMNQRFPDCFNVSARGLYAGHSVTMEGTTQEAEAQLRTTRQRLSALTGICPDNFGRYTFHITLGYILHWIPSEEAAALEVFSDRIFAKYMDALQGLVLGPLELCNFEDMHHFSPVALLTQ